jgi:DNA-binding beta-propeller fold protein YncE
VSAAAPEAAPKILWSSHGSVVSKPCTYSPAVDAEGRIWVAVCWESRFWIFNASGQFIEAWGTQGAAPGDFDFAYAPSHDSIGGIAFAPDGTFYTFDAGNLRIQHFDRGRKLLKTWGSFGAGPGQFAKPTSIAVGRDGLVYVADGARSDVQAFAADGTYLQTLATGHAGQPDHFARIALDSGGNLYVNEGHTILKYSPDGTPLFVIDVGALTSDPAGIAISPNGALFVLGRPDSGPQVTLELTKDGGLQHVWPGTGETVALDPAGKAIYVSDVESPNVTKYQLPTP